MSCGSSAEQLPDEEIERLANEEFRALSDTLRKQTEHTCDSLYGQYRQAMVDSLIFEYLKSEDSTANSNTTNSIKTPNQ
jgi:hypothetical protein